MGGQVTWIGGGCCWDAERPPGPASYAADLQHLPRQMSDPSKMPPSPRTEDLPSTEKPGDSKSPLQATLVDIRQRDSVHSDTIEDPRKTPLSPLEVRSPLVPPSEDTKLMVADPPEPQYGAPQLAPWVVFYRFLYFGIRAWGGPAAQIDMLKTELVIGEKWCSPSQFTRVMAVYQALPGPEAFELCCYFGMLAGGRLGAFLAGLGFMLPGFCLMLLCSWVYVSYDVLKVTRVLATFRAVQPAVAAVMLRAVHRLTEHAITDHEAKPARFDPLLALGYVVAIVFTLCNIPFFITLGVVGLANLAGNLGNRWNSWGHYGLGISILALGILGDALYLAYRGLPSTLALGVGLSAGNDDYATLFIMGLFGGLLTFGGAYTAVPMIKHASVDLQGWLTPEQFLDGFAIGSILPCPLVIFVTFVGYLGGRFPGAFLMTLGMFLPAWSFPIIGHNLFDKIVHIDTIASFLHGVTAGMVGLIAVTAIEFATKSIQDPLEAVVYVVVLGGMYHFTHRAASIGLIIGAGLAGQVLFVPGS
eukprot:NODE_200_length_1831_cov_476.610550_g150_i0.p1 GENE.NODE_200_length_1831_cov_476.610550_g150_i0~~NODE_200_length_1831_cov_476.610550_g150_i0.p1  ORF type:complete len:540 (+),score=110.24 NODE_200_length_1831_cov_476.610550_g150_i0:31-1620(+)